MGIDPSSWGTEYELVGTEDLNGVEVYHVKAAADPQKLADSLVKAAEDPALQDKLGGSGSELGELSEGLTQNKQQAEGGKAQGRQRLLDRRRGPVHARPVRRVLDLGQKDMEGVTA
jgi:hypothetical protein